MRAVLIAALTLPLLAGTLGSRAHADQGFWELPDSAPEKLYEALMAKGDQLVLEAIHEGSASLARQAIEAYEAAAEVLPSREEPHLAAAESISAFFLRENRSPHSMLKRAIAHWDRFEELAPLDPRLPSILFARSIALTKLSSPKNIERAIRDYDHELRLLDETDEAVRENVATILSNRAELQMMLGRLDDAIKGYEESLRFNTDALAGFGLAVALDRDRQGLRAREVAASFARLDTNNALTRSGTFFVPAGEKFYYLALRSEGAGDYRSAAEHYRNFLRMLPGSPWAERAKENLKAVVPKANRQPRPRPSRAFDEGIW